MSTWRKMGRDGGRRRACCRERLAEVDRLRVIVAVGVVVAATAVVMM